MKRAYPARQWQEDRVLSSANNVDRGQLFPQAVYYAAVDLAVGARTATETDLDSLRDVPREDGTADV